MIIMLIIKMVDIHEFKQIHNGNYMGLVPDYSQLGPIHQGIGPFI